MRHLVAWIVGLTAGRATGAAIYALARRKNFAAVEKAGEGGFVWFLIAMRAISSDSITLQNAALPGWLSRRAASAARSGRRAVAPR